MPLRVDALAETTPGNAVRALVMRRSHAVQVIPATGTVMSSFAARLVAFVTVMALALPRLPEWLS